MGLILYTTLTATAGAIKGAATAWSKYEKSKQQQAQLQKEIDKLNEDLGRLEDSYSQNQSALTNQKDRSVKNLNWNINQTQSVRDTSAQNSSVSNVAKQDSMYRELSTVIANMADTEGSFNQSLATTGARNSGTSSVRQQQVQTEARQTIDSSMQNVKLTSQQMASEAISNFWSSSAQMENYSNSIEDTKAAFEEQMASLRLQYEQNKADINYNIEQAKDAYSNAEYSGWDWVVDIFTAGLTTASDSYDAYVNAKKAYSTSLSYDGIETSEKNRNI